MCPLATDKSVTQNSRFRPILGFSPLKEESTGARTRITPNGIFRTDHQMVRGGTDTFMYELLSQIYNIESKQYKKGTKVPPIDFLFNKIYNPIHGTFNKKTNVNTIKSFLTLEDISNLTFPNSFIK